MSYRGDIRLGGTLDIHFTTVDSTGAPTTLAGTPVVSAYVGNGTTEITAGITLTVDFDGRTGMHNVRVVASSGNGFATATDVDLVITTGTVSGVSVVGYVIGAFSIEARSAVMPTTAARTLDVSATGEAGVDWANVGSPTTTLALTGTTIATTQKVDIETIKTNPVVNGGTITFPTTATLASTTNITAGTITTATNVTTVNGLAANVITAASMAADASAEIADAVWDELKSGHTVADSFGDYLDDEITSRATAADVPTAAVIADAVLDEDMTGHQTQGTLGQAIGDPVADTNTIYKAVVTDATGSTVGLDVSDILTLVTGLTDATVHAAGSADSGTTTTLVDNALTQADTDYWKGAFIHFTSGNIDGQTRLITGFDPATDTITFTPATTQAVATHGYQIVTSARCDVELWDGSAVNALVSGRVDASVGAMAAGVITAAAVATGAIDADALATDAVAEIADGVWDEAIAGHLGAGSTGEALNNATAPTAATVADAVWDELLAGHVGVGSAGLALTSAGSAGDPWATLIPGAYGAGTAGKILGDNVNATISSRATQTSVDAVDDFVDTEVAAIKAKTDLIPAAPAAVGDIPTATQNADALLKRDMSAVTGESARSPLNALRFLRNKWSIAAGTLTVTKEDDTTSAWTSAMTTDAAADPIVSSDPA